MALRISPTFAAMKLFDDKLRTDINPGKYADDGYTILDRSAIPELEGIRNTLNHWFEHYPDAEKLDFKKRLKKTFSPTLYELFLYELFINQGFTVTIHPTLPNSEKRPDFLLSKNGIEIYAEAKEVLDKSHAEIGIEKIENAIYDGLNSMECPDFFVMKRKLLLKSGRQPSAKKMNRFFEGQIKYHDADVVSEQKHVTGLPHLCYEDEDVKLEVALLPRLKSARGLPDIRPFGGGMGETTWGGNERSLYDGLKQKSSRYGELDKPYLICVNATNNFGATAVSVKAALFGSLQVTWSENPRNRDTRLEHANDGFFCGPKGPQFRRVSAVLATNFDIGKMRSPEHWLVKHPFAEKTLDLSLFDLSYTHVIGNQIVTVDRKSVGEIITFPR